MTTLADLKVGDTAVIVRPGRYGYETEVTVTKVARVYITVRGSERYAEWMFRIDTGHEKGSLGYGETPKLRTRDEIAAESRRLLVVNRLRDFGIEIRMGYTNTLATETLEAILAAIPNTNPTEGSAT